MDTGLGGVWRAEVSISPCLAVSSFSLSHYRLSASLSESGRLSDFSHTLSASQFLFLRRVLRSGHLREMSVRDKDTRKNPGWVSRKRGQGHKDN